MTQHALKVSASGDVARGSDVIAQTIRALGYPTLGAPMSLDAPMFGDGPRLN
jgi:hypothetical protein